MTGEPMKHDWGEVPSDDPPPIVQRPTSNVRYKEGVKMPKRKVGRAGKKGKLTRP